MNSLKRQIVSRKGRQIMWNEYPRPQMKRADWQSLNGDWTCNGQACYVPECRFEEELLYEKKFKFARSKDRALLHFGAVDQIAEVRLNGVFLGRHCGGYLSFTYEVTHAIKDGDNLLQVHVIDHLDHKYPYGKQRKDRGGMWYTPVSGIWQTVWLEEVPSRFIEDIRIKADLKGAEVELHIDDNGAKLIKNKKFNITNPICWTPENPKLYTRKIKEADDEVEIYFALRTVSVENVRGANRVCLNGKPIFMHGVLDQGYFEDGIYLPKDPKEYERDIIRLKELGFNMLRKHIKVEPETFYYDCDRLGILVIQDMVNSGDYNFPRDTVLGTTASILPIKYNDRRGIIGERELFWIEHMKETIKALRNHPSIICWTLFNEGWGQFCSDEFYDIAKGLDNSRLIDTTSGWFAQEKSDFDSEHVYFRTKNLKPKQRPMLLSECGGYSLNLKDREGTYGYGKCKDKAELTERIISMYEKMVIPAIGRGLCGCIYTQLSDVEDEINGLYSYDRSTCKVDAEKMRALAERIYGRL